MDETVINILWAIGGFIVGGFVTYEFKILWYKRTTFIAACVKFEQSLAETIYQLKHNFTLHTPGKLKGFKEKHITAMNNFRVFLPERKKSDFDTACEKFFNIKDGQYYIGYGGDKKKSSELALKNIEGVLLFANTKFCAFIKVAHNQVL